MQTCGFVRRAMARAIHVTLFYGNHIEELCKSGGLCLKVYANQLVVFKEAVFEAELSMGAIIEGKSPIIGFPSFKRDAKDVYKSCEVSHFDPKNDKTYVGHIEATNVGDVGHTLTIRVRFDSESDDI